MDLTNFNLKRFNNITKQSTLLPSGEYTCILDSSSQSTLQDGSTMLRLIWKIVDGKYEGNYFFSYFKMGLEESLKVLFRMIDNMGFEADKVRNIKELHGSQCLLKVKLFNHILHGKSNIVERYLPVNSSNSQNFDYGFLFSTPSVSNQLA